MRPSPWMRWERAPAPVQRRLDIKGLFPDTGAADELAVRRAAGHQEGCLCQSKPGPSCRELRIRVGR